MHTTLRTFTQVVVRHVTESARCFWIKKWPRATRSFTKPVEINELCDPPQHMYAVCGLIVQKSSSSQLVAQNELEPRRCI